MSWREVRGTSWCDFLIFIQHPQNSRHQLNGPQHENHRTPWWMFLTHVVELWAFVIFFWSWNLLLSKVCNRYQPVIIQQHTPTASIILGGLIHSELSEQLSGTDMRNFRKCISHVKARHLTLGTSQMARAGDGWQQPVWRKTSNLLVGLNLSEEKQLISCKNMQSLWHASTGFVGSNSCLFLQASHLDSSLFVESTTRFFERNPYLSFTCRESQAFWHSRTARHSIGSFHKQVQLNLRS